MPKNYRIDLSVSFTIDFTDCEAKPTEEEIRDYIKDILKLGEMKDYVLPNDFEIEEIREDN